MKRERLSVTTDAGIAVRQKADDEESHRARRRLSLMQSEFSLRFDVLLDTIRTWEQGNRSPR